MIRSILALTLSLGALTLAPLHAGAEPPPLLAQRFEPGEVKLLDGPFKTALDLDARFLLGLEPDRLLAWYRKNAGLEPKGEVYGGWESQGIAGHCLGHYLSGCALMFRATGNEEFQKRVDYIVSELAECQRAAKDGFIGAMPNGRRVFEEVSRGEIRSAGFDLNGSWVPWYNLHKVFAGLIDAHRWCENGEALEVAGKLADWAIATTQSLTEDQWQRMMACEHGGMNESLAELSALTGNEAYMDLARKFYHRAVLDGLAAGQDTIAGKHANTQIPKAIGAARIYQLTGRADFGRIANNFWDIVVKYHTYVTGGNSDGEHFGAPHRLSDRLGLNTTETCNVYNMLKLTAALFELEPRPEYAEYMERALWNHILAARHPETGHVCYYLTLKPGETRRYVGDRDFTCCNGSGMEIPARNADYIYFQNGAGDVEPKLWVNQFIPSEVLWRRCGATLRQETEFPVKPRTILTVSCPAPTVFTLYFRHPSWIAGPLALTINGERQTIVSTPGGYADIKRTWKDGDRLELDLPMTLRTEAMPDNVKRIAVFNGPILLAGNLTAAAGDDERVPVLVTDERPVDDWVKPAPEQPEQLHFRTDNVGRPRDVLLLPFFRAHDMPATVFFDAFDESQWQERQAQYEAEQKRRAALEARTVDYLAIGEMQAERDHAVVGENTEPGEWQGRKLRHATDGGWFSCELAVPSTGAAELIVDYWGSENGPREFEVLVDEQVIATTRLAMDAPGRFWERAYPLPAELIAEKSKITLKFDAKPGNYAGGVFGIRVVRPE